MTKWEYRSEKVDSNFVVDIISMCKHLGLHGWELVQHTEVSCSVRRPVQILIFKRRLRGWPFNR